jgi:hypothetical protein
MRWRNWARYRAFDPHHALGNGHAAILDADETTPVEPGDVIDVRNETSDILPHDEAAARLMSRSSKTEQARDQKRQPDFQIAD